MLLKSGEYINVGDYAAMRSALEDAINRGREWVGSPDCLVQVSEIAVLLEREDKK